MSYDHRSTATAKALDIMPTSINGVIGMLADAAVRLENAAEMTKVFADRLSGSTALVADKLGGPRPVADGQVEQLADLVMRLNNALNGMMHDNGRIERAVIG